MKLICERLNDQGFGISYINGKIIFVPEFIPGDEAEVEILLEKKKYMEGKVLKYIKYSPDRIEPFCKYLNCGCSIKSLDYEKQLQYKEEKVKNIIKKFCGLSDVVEEIIPSKKITGYRNKITLKVRKKVGYYKNKSNDFIEICSCLLADGKINKIIKLLNTLDLSKVNEITIKNFNQTMIIVDGILDYEKLKDYANSIYMNGKIVYGDEYITTNICGLNFKISKDAFFQVNTSMIERLYKTAIEQIKGKKTALDLFCGTGTISLILSKYFQKVIGIEINKEAVECADENKKLNNIENVEFICGDANKLCEKISADVVFVDPPRCGLSKAGIDNILSINPDSIVYISCNPITLARDLNLLKEKYNINKVIPIDLFPNTYHVESVCVLQKK